MEEFKEIKCFVRNIDRCKWVGKCEGKITARILVSSVVDEEETYKRVIRENSRIDKE